MITHNLDLRTATLTITVPGDMLSTNIDELREQFGRLLGVESIRLGNWRLLHLDLSGARMVDSSGLNFLVALIRQVKSRPATVQATITSSHVHRTFLFMRLDEQMTLTTLTAAR